MKLLLLLSAYFIFESLNVERNLNKNKKNLFKTFEIIFNLQRNMWSQRSNFRLYILLAVKRFNVQSLMTFVWSISVYNSIALCAYVWTNGMIEWSFFFLHAHASKHRYSHEYTSTQKPLTDRHTERKRKKHSIPNFAVILNLIHEFNSIWFISITFACYFYLTIFALFSNSCSFRINFLLVVCNLWLLYRIYGCFVIDGERKKKNLICVSPLNHSLMTKSLIFCFAGESDTEQLKFSKIAVPKY